jgi:hypothetical protein
MLFSFLTARAHPPGDPSGVERRIQFVDRNAVLLDAAAVKLGGEKVKRPLYLLTEKIRGEGRAEDQPDILGKFVAEGNGSNGMSIPMGSQVVKDFHRVCLRTIR